MSRGGGWEDHYTRRARAEHWLARSVYKLMEIDRRFRILRAGDRVLDLGAYPGSWSQYCLKKTGRKGDVVGIDLKRPLGFSHANFRFIQGDALAMDGDQLPREVGKRNVVLSDLAPRTTGIHVADTSRSLELAERALTISLGVLEPGGHLVCKVFEGDGLRAFKSNAAASFHRVRLIRPAAVRKKSREVYLVGLERVDPLGGE